MSERYRKSEALLERALKVIPLGSQTFSKSITQYPLGISPYFIERAKGSHAWDVDGNEYVDFVSSLCAVNLGYCDQDVDNAVRAQMENGVTLSLAHRLEMEVAERIVEMIPCAEKVRFGKNGTDGTSAAIRIARAHTGRDRVAVCGYHGWQDWYIGSTTRHLGVPSAVRGLTHVFAYNDPASLAAILEAHPGEFAAVILEPMNVHFPKDGFLEKVRDLTHAHGAVLVFDETITGFRFANGGAQELFGVIPDLASFGKGLANGYPLSAITGRADLMDVMEKIFFSGTFGGETLSLAAARAVIDKMKSQPVVETLIATGTAIQQGLTRLIEKHACGHFLSISGHPTWTFLLMADANGQSQWEIKTLYMQEILARGILSLGSHEVSYAHTPADVARLLEVYDEVFPILAEAVAAGDVVSRLRCKPLVPLFKVRG